MKPLALFCCYDALKGLLVTKISAAPREIIWRRAAPA